MRTNITDPGAGNLKYEIRKIVEVAEKIKSFGVPIIWENIGDPIAKNGMFGILSVTEFKYLKANFVNEISF